MSSIDPGDPIIGRYEILYGIAQRDPERIYCALDTMTNRQVLLRMLPAEAAERDPEAWGECRCRFRREFQATHEITHPNVLSTRALESDAAGNLYLVQDWVQGKTLTEVLAERGALLPEEAIAIARQIAKGLRAIHERGIIHRDIKPAHILLQDDGPAVLAGFHSAQLPEEVTTSQRPTAHPGTPAYMSPEQAVTTGYLDQRSDLYALSLVLYEMLTGEPYVRRRLPPTMVNPSIPSSLAAVVTKGLEREPDARYQSADELIADLERVDEQSLPGQLRLVLGRLPWREALPAAGLVLALVLVASLWRLSSQMSDYREVATRGTQAPESGATGAPLPQVYEEGAAPTPGTAADPYEPDDTQPVPISLGERQPRAFEGEGDLDRAILRVKPGVSYLIYTDELVPGVDTRLEVVVGGRSLINDDRAPGDLRSEVGFTASEEGVAVITVSNQDRYGPGQTYVLAVDALPPTPTMEMVPSPTISPSRTPRPTYTPAEVTPTSRPTYTPSETSTPGTPTETPTPTSTRTPTPTRTPTVTRTPTPTRTPIHTSTPTNTPLPTSTPTRPGTPLPIRPTGPPTE